MYFRCTRAECGPITKLNSYTDGKRKVDAFEIRFNRKMFEIQWSERGTNHRVPLTQLRKFKTRGIVLMSEETK